MTTQYEQFLNMLDNVKQFSPRVYDDLAHEDGFALNNMGYLSEIDGDHETADVYYQKARTAERSGAHVTAATRRDSDRRSFGRFG